MKKNKLLLTVSLCYATALSAQSSHPTPFLTDSSDTKPLNEVVVKAYEQHRKLTEVGAPVSIVSKASLNRFGNMSILPALNTNPGVRMEERSPPQVSMQPSGYGTLRPDVRFPFFPAIRFLLVHLASARTENRLFPAATTAARASGRLRRVNYWQLLSRSTGAQIGLWLLQTVSLTGRRARGARFSGGFPRISLT